MEQKKREGGGGGSKPSGLGAKIRDKLQKKKKERRKGKGHTAKIGPSLVTISLTRRWGAAARP